MGVVIPEGYANVALRFTVVGGTSLMVTTFGVTRTTETAEDIGEEVEAAIIASAWFVPAGMFTSYVFQDIVVTLMTATGPVTHVEPRNQVGTIGTNNPVPNNTALLVRKTTARGGRAGRGRMYVPPASVPETSVDGAGNLAGAQVDDQQAKASAFLLDLATQGIPMVLLHEDPALEPDLVLSLSVQSKLATQRTRMR